MRHPHNALTPTEELFDGLLHALVSFGCVLVALVAALPWILILSRLENTLSSRRWWSALTAIVCYQIIMTAVLCGTMSQNPVLFDDIARWNSANTALSIRAWAWLLFSEITTELATSISADQPMPAHFVVTLPPVSAVLKPAKVVPIVLSPAQRCAIEAALRLTRNVNVWICGHSLVGQAEWRSWRRSLSSRDDVGALRVRLHRFDAMTTVGAWVHRRTGGHPAFDAALWHNRSLPTFGSFVSDLVRIDVLERFGGVYIDADVIAMDAALFRLSDGIALQAASVPWHPFPREGSMYEALNAAVLVSAKPASRVAQAIGRATVAQLDAYNVMTIWGGRHPLGPSAVTAAWVSGEMGHGVHLYRGVTFGYVTCGYELAARRGRVLKATARREWLCRAFSSSDLPLDWPRVGEDEYNEYRSGRLAQHGLKSLHPTHRHHTSTVWYGTIRQRLAQDQCRVTASEIWVSGGGARNRSTALWPRPRVPS